jgi:hypothetical protein
VRRLKQLRFSKRCVRRSMLHRKFSTTRSLRANRSDGRDLQIQGSLLRIIGPFGQVSLQGCLHHAKPLHGRLFGGIAGSRRAPIRDSRCRARYFRVSAARLGRCYSIFEVDHPASQEWKRGCLEVAEVQIPRNLTFAPIDFEITSLREGLSAAGFDFRTPSFFSLLGVTQYLTAEAIDSIFGFIQSLPGGSEIVFEIIVPDDLMPAEEAGVFATAASMSAARGEPWLTRLRPIELLAKLTARGFSQVTHLSPEAGNDRYFRGRRDDLAAWSAAQMMRAIV